MNLFFEKLFNLILTWSANCVISEVDRETTFAITNTKFYVPVVTLSIQDNTKLLQPLNSGFKSTITGININQKDQQKDKINI